jgi:hypothetical protein
VYTVSLLSEHPTSDSTFFEHHQHSLNSSSWNETLAEQLRGAWDWALTDRFDMQLKERPVTIDVGLASNVTEIVDPAVVPDFGKFSDWTWVRGSLTLHAKDETLDYNFHGFHYLPNGTYGLYAVADGRRNDIRNIPQLFGDKDLDELIEAQLAKEVLTLQDSIMSPDIRPDGSYNSEKRCQLTRNRRIGPRLSTGHMADAPSSASWDITRGN